MAGAYSLKALSTGTGELAAAKAFSSMRTTNVADLSITDTLKGLEWQAPTLHESPQRRLERQRHLEPKWLRINAIVSFVVHV